MSPRSASTIDSDTDSVYDGDDLWDDTSFATDLTDAFDRPGLTDVQMRVDDDEGSVYDGDSMYEDDDSDKMFEVLATMDATGCAVFPVRVNESEKLSTSDEAIPGLICIASVVRHEAHANPYFNVATITTAVAWTRRDDRLRRRWKPSPTSINLENLPKLPSLGFDWPMRVIWSAGANDPLDLYPQCVARGDSLLLAAARIALDATTESDEDLNKLQLASSCLRFFAEHFHLSIPTTPKVSHGRRCTTAFCAYIGALAVDIAFPQDGMECLLELFGPRVLPDLHEIPPARSSLEDVPLPSPASPVPATTLISSPPPPAIVIRDNVVRASPSKRRFEPRDLKATATPAEEVQQRDEAFRVLSLQPSLELQSHSPPAAIVLADDSNHESSYDFIDAALGMIAVAQDSEDDDEADRCVVRSRNITSSKPLRNSQAPRPGFSPCETLTLDDSDDESSFDFIDLALGMIAVAKESQSGYATEVEVDSGHDSDIIIIDDKLNEGSDSDTTSDSGDESSSMDDENDRVESESQWEDEEEEKEDNGDEMSGPSDSDSMSDDDEDEDDEMRSEAGMYRASPSPSSVSGDSDSAVNEGMRSDMHHYYAPAPLPLERPRSSAVAASLSRRSRLHRSRSNYRTWSPPDDWVACPLTINYDMLPPLPELEDCLRTDVFRGVNAVENDRHYRVLAELGDCMIFRHVFDCINLRSVHVVKSSRMRDRLVQNNVLSYLAHHYGMHVSSRRVYWRDHQHAAGDSFEAFVAVALLTLDAVSIFYAWLAQVFNSEVFPAIARIEQPWGSVVQRCKEQRLKDGVAKGLRMHRQKERVLLEREAEFVDGWEDE